jgi:hypothetical protein
MSDTMHTTRPPKRGIELPAAVALSWSLIGGLVLGGAGVAAMIFAGRMSGHLMLMGSTVLFVIGAMLGLAHGVILGLFGRPAEWTVGKAGNALLHGMLWIGPTLLIGWLLAGWMAALPIALGGQRYLASAISVLAWVAMFAAMPWALRRGVEAARLAYARWDDRILGTLLIAVVGSALVVAFAITPPTIWFTGTTFSRTGGLFFAGFLTFWFYGPLITAALHLSRRLRGVAAKEMTERTWKHALVSVGIAVGVGLMLAAVAIPFYRGAPGLTSGVERLGFWPAFAATLATAFADEMLFRLIVITLAFAVTQRYLTHDRNRAIVVAVAFATLMDLFLHAPAALVLGLPGASLLAGFVTLRMAIPAILFGYLYYRRGLGTAVAAHLTADAALLLLAA